MQWLLEINTGLVVDPFVGSGTTILAADKLNRPCYAAEMSPAIAAVCLERLAEVGKRPRVKGRGVGLRMIGQGNTFPGSHCDLPTLPTGDRSESR